MSNRVIEFKITQGTKVLGYERLENGQWIWMCPALNPISGERWYPGIFDLSNQIGAKLERWQWIGILDLNGEKIYEGDIIEYLGRNKSYSKVKDEFKVRAVVKWVDGVEEGVNSSLFNSKEPRFETEDIGPKQRVCVDWCEFANCRVIGNIYQNPELAIWQEPKPRPRHTRSSK